MGGGARFRILRGPGGPNSQQAYDVVLTSMRRNDVASTSFRCHVPTRFLIHQCQIITFLILKSDIIENSRIELRGIVLPAPSNHIKVTFIIVLPFNLFHIENEEKGGWIIGGAKGYVGPPALKLFGGPGPPSPPLTPASYAYGNFTWLDIFLVVVISAPLTMFPVSEAEVLNGS